MNDYRIQMVKGHYEVYDRSGRFLFSADNLAEAAMELDAE